MGVSNVLTSTAAGAGAGFAVGGPWAGLAGGAIGLAAGLFGEYEAAQSEEEKRKVLEKASQQLNTSIANLQTKLDEYYRQNESIGTAEDKLKYQELAHGFDPNEFVYDYEDFDDNYDVNDYYAANRQAIIDKTSDQLQFTAAGAGIGRGTGAANQIATGVANKNEELYRDALQAMNQDRQFAYNLWNSQIQLGQNRLNQLRSAKEAQLSLYGNLAQDYQQWNQEKAQAYMDLEKEKMNNQLELTLSSI